MSGPFNGVRPLADQVERRHPPILGFHPEVRDPPAEVDVDLVDRVAIRATLVD